MSRYCIEQAETTDQLQCVVTPVTVPEPEAEKEAQTEEAESESSVGQGASARVQPASPRRQFVQNQKTDAQQNGLAMTAGAIPVWVFPTVCAVWILISIVLGIATVDANAYAFPICEQSTGASETCVLAVQLSGDESYLAAVESEVAEQPMTPEIEAEAFDLCSQVGEFRMRSQYPADRPRSAEADEVLSRQTHTVFPGVFLVDIVQQSTADIPDTSGEPMRTACLSYLTTYTDADAFEYGVTVGDVGLINIANDQIPLSWPEEPYAEMSEAEIASAN